MVRQTYDNFRLQIIGRLRERGFELSRQVDISAAVLEGIRSSTSVTGARSRVLEIERKNSLQAFIDVLSETSYNISDSALQKLINRFKTENAIAEVNRFIELDFTGKDAVLKGWREKLTRISNKLRGENTISLNKTRAKVRQTISDMKKTMQNEFFPNLFTTAVKLLAGTGAVLGAIGFGAGFTGLSPGFEALVGFVPLGSFGVGSPTSIQEIEVAHSNKEVKFRAVGSIFLAHQIGGQDSIRITGKLTGPSRFFWLSLLWLLTLISKGESVTFDASPNSIGVPTAEELFTRSAISPLEKVEKRISQKASFRNHKTFYCILTHEIITNCYVETFSFEQSVVGLQDTITYDLLLRTYDQPKEFLWNSKSAIYQLSNSKAHTQDRLRFIANFMYRLSRQLISDAVDLSSWKTEDYYDVDVADMGFTFFMGLL